MYLSTTAQDDTAVRIAEWVRENTAGYVAVATKVGRAGYPDAAAVAITRECETTCTAKVFVYSNRFVYVSKLGGRISYPITFEEAGRVVGAFLSLEDD